ncbi:MAG: error-prone DNA polymerase [Myxococcales bacterium]|nr:error-prone DNA polymerase [Myxococcales bacterium]
MSRYVPLWVRSNFSFLEGAAHPDEYVEEAARLGLHAIALTDRDGVHGIVRAHVAARKTGTQLLIGTELTVEQTDRLVVLATDRVSYGAMCGLISQGRLRCPKGESSVTFPEVLQAAPGLIALYGTSGAPDRHDPVVKQRLAGLCDAFGDRLYMVVARHRTVADRMVERAARDCAAHYGIATVAAPEVLYTGPERRDLQDIVTSIRHGLAVQRIGTRTKPNAEFGLRTPQAMLDLYRDDIPSVLRTLEIAERCHFSLDDIRYRYPSETLSEGETSTQRLQQLTWSGAHARYQGRIPDDVRLQLDKELALIEELDYGGYFLTMHDIVQWCKSQQILCQGRGSAANSIVCYCLGITAIDPVRLGLLFERFLSRERAEPPDIDLDIAHERREEVIQWVYQRYGRDHAAMVANVVRYRPRSAVRDVGKALGIPTTTLDRVARLLSHRAHVDANVLLQAGLDPETPLHRHLIRLSNDLLGFPRHLSIHPGGFILGHEPVHSLVPIENATMPDRTVIQWDKEDVEALGLFKVDLLGLGALSHIDRCLRMLRTHREVDLTLADIPAHDTATFEMIQRAETVGVFQIESRAQMQMLPRLRPQNFYDLVIEVSIVRPGPITGDMVHPYLRRRRGEEKVEYPHPSLQEVLAKTLGVPLFQEQVMKLAIIAADYTPGEADQLRRDMGAWRSEGRMEQHRTRIVSRMMSRGIAQEFAERVFHQIRGFGEYGFPESHAASFALISWATAWLRCHFPAAFTASLLNAMPMGFYSASTVIDEARRRGVEFRRADIQLSDWECTLEPSAPGHCDVHAVRLGLRPIRGLQVAHWEQIQRARQTAPFLSIDDLARRAALPRSTLEALARAGALTSLETDRRSALWLAGNSPIEPELRWLDTDEAIPEFQPLSNFDLVGWDYRTMERSPEQHPLSPLRPRLQAINLPDAQTIAQLQDGARARFAGLVICRQRPGTAGGVVFMTLEDETGFVNVVLWQNVFEKYQVLAKTLSFLGVSGLIQAREGITHLIAEQLWQPRLDKEPRLVGSRDFH